MTAGPGGASSPVEPPKAETSLSCRHHSPRPFCGDLMAFLAAGLLRCDGKPSIHGSFLEAVDPAWDLTGPLDFGLLPWLQTRVPWGVWKSRFLGLSSDLRNISEVFLCVSGVLPGLGIPK